MSSEYWWAERRWHMGLLIALVVLLYGRTLQYDYTLDDAIVITENTFTKRGVRGIPDILRYDSFRGFFNKEGKDQLVAGGRYRPLTMIVFALEWQLFGPRPGVFHAVNVLLYLGLVLAIYQLLLRVLRQAIPGRPYPEVGALLGAALFAVHPLHVEVVANIKGGDEVVSLLLVVGTLYFLLRKGEVSLRVSDYLVSSVLAFLAMLSKENAIVLVVWIPLFLYLLEGHSLRTSMQRTLGVFAGISIYLAVRLWILGSGLHRGTVSELMNNPFLKVVGDRYVPFDIVERISSILYAQSMYFRLMFYPHPLTHDYYPRAIPITGLGDIHVLLGMAITLGMVSAGLYLLWRRSVWALIPLIYLVPISIVSNALFPIGTHMGERFAFYSTLALSLSAVLVWGFGSRTIRQWGVGIIALILLGMAIKTWSRESVWKDDFTLFTHDVYLSPNSAKARNAVAGALVQAASEIQDSTKRQAYYREAVEHERMALKIHPSYGGAHYIKGLAEFGLGQYDAAIASISSAMRLSGDKSEMADALFQVYIEAAKYRGEKQGDPAGAIRYLRQATQLKEDDPELYRLLGVAHGVLKQYPQAIRYFKTALRYAPNHQDLYENISLTYRFMHQLDSADVYAAIARTLSVGRDRNK